MIRAKLPPKVVKFKIRDERYVDDVRSEIYDLVAGVHKPAWIIFIEVPEEHLEMIGKLKEIHDELKQDNVHFILHSKNIKVSEFFEVRSSKTTSKAKRKTKHS